MDKTDRIWDVLVGMDDGELLTLYREYCSKTNNMEEYVFEMFEFDDQFSGCSPVEIADKVQNSSNFDINDNYFKFTMWGLESEQYVEDIIDTDELARHIADTKDSYGNKEIQEVLDSEDEEEDEEE